MNFKIGHTWSTLSLLLPPLLLYYYTFTTLDVAPVIICCKINFVSSQSHSIFSYRCVFVSRDGRNFRCALLC